MDSTILTNQLLPPGQGVKAAEKSGILRAAGAGQSSGESQPLFAAVHAALLMQRPTEGPAATEAAAKIGHSSATSGKSLPQLPLNPELMHLRAAQGGPAETGPNALRFTADGRSAQQGQAKPGLPVLSPSSQPGLSLRAEISGPDVAGAPGARLLTAPIDRISVLHQQDLLSPSSARPPERPLGVLTAALINTTAQTETTDQAAPVVRPVSQTEPPGARSLLENALPKPAGAENSPQSLPPQAHVTSATQAPPIRPDVEQLLRVPSAPATESLRPAIAGGAAEHAASAHPVSAEPLRTSAQGVAGAPLGVANTPTNAESIGTPAKRREKIAAAELPTLNNDIRSPSVTVNKVLPINVKDIAGMVATASTAEPGPQTQTDTVTSLTQPLPTVNSQSKISGAAQPSPLPVGDPTAFREGMVEQLAVMSRNGVHNAKIALHPQDLGPIEVRLIVRQDEVSVQLATQHGAVRELIDDAMPRLREMFDQVGLKLQQYSVASEFSDRGGQAQRFVDEQAGEPSRLANEAFGGETHEHPTRAPNALVDTYI